MYRQVNPPESRWPWILLSLVSACLLFSLLVPAELITQVLTTDADNARKEQLRQGSLLLKWLVGLDGLLLLILVFFTRLAAPGSESFTPIWHSPAAQAHATDDRMAWIRWLMAIVCVAAVLRLYRLDSDLWIDEVLTLVNYVRLPLGDAISSFEDDNQHLLFSAMARISVVVFGESAWSLRLPAVLAGVASIWVTAKLAHYVFDARIAVLSALLLCVSWHHIWYSQNARGYTLLLLGTLYATFYLLKALETNRWRYWLLYALVIALSVMSHLTAVFVAMAHAMVVAACLLIKLRPLNHWYRPLAGFSLSAWFTLHAYALVMPQMASFFLPDEPQAVRLDNQWRNPLWLVNETLRSLGIPLQIGWLELIAGALLALVIAWIFRRKNWLFLSLTLLPGVILGMAMVLLDRNLWPRLFFNLAGFVVIFMAVVSFFIGDKFAKLLKSKPVLISWAPGVLLCLLFAQALPSLYRYPKQDFTGARDFVLASAEPSDTVLGVHMVGKMNHLYYQPSWGVVQSLDELQRQRSEVANTWIIYTLENYLKKSRPDLYQELTLNSEFIREFPGTLGNGNIIVRRYARNHQVQP